MLCFDYTGYGLNSGQPCETACYEDIRSVFAWLTGSKGVPSERILLYVGLFPPTPFSLKTNVPWRSLGKSIGSGPVIDLVASLAPSLSRLKRGSRISHFGRGLIWGRGNGDGEGEEDGSYSSIAGMILHSAFTSIGDVAGSRFHHSLGLDIFDNLKKADRVRCPVLLLHGTHDVIVPKQHSEVISRLI